eukprot:365862-Chlamydomonas_euryale.AAC.5
MRAFMHILWMHAAFSICCTMLLDCLQHLIIESLTIDVFLSAGKAPLHRPAVLRIPTHPFLIMQTRCQWLCCARPTPPPWRPRA